jgi:anti-anti-sigma regulatory factor
VLEAVRQRAALQNDLRMVVCDLSNAPHVDIAGARMLRRLQEEMAANQVDFKIVEAHAPVRDILRAEGLEERIGAISRYHGLAQLLDEYRSPSG